MEIWCLRVRIWCRNEWIHRSLVGLPLLSIGWASSFGDAGASSEFSLSGSAVATTSGDDIFKFRPCLPYCSRDLSHVGFNSRNLLLWRCIPFVHGSGGPCRCTNWLLCSMVIAGDKATDGLQGMEFVADRSWPSQACMVALDW